MCELVNHIRWKYKWCSQKKISPPLLCLPCEVEILHLFHMPTNLKSNNITTVNQTLPPSGFEHAIDNKHNTKNLERELLRKHENYYLYKIKDDIHYKKNLEI